ncbi:threonine synthase [Winogradskya consettensis]|uniref:Threonine synthase n=1 Tax=Winogradskya consettensis TaxID=113560 RepID=A0A919SJH7_9ACTN|nr:pyridoxal-phosphate dependent enzyme [Actinoplanes consettensis]GIM72846.1 threonine synthase [Actinoplanes consettensis]
MKLRCASCGQTYALSDLAWRCTHCHGMLDLTGFTPVMPPPGDLALRRPSLWRYAEALPIAEPLGITLGEGFSPLVSAPGRPGVQLKVDYLMPTGSFKDRGAVLLVALAASLGVTRLMTDSSGNAGTAVAAYAARAGISCGVYVPESTSAGKVAQLRAYGAEVFQIPGSREDTAEAAARAADVPGVFYASHVYHPFFLQGTKTYVLELWEQSGGRLPETLVLPVGNGTLVLGAYLGCVELLSQGLIDRLPRIVAVQAARCAPLATAFADGLPAPAGLTLPGLTVPGLTVPGLTPSGLTPSGVTPSGVTSSGLTSSGNTASGTVAEGIAIARPARGAQILSAVRETGGSIVTVTDDQIHSAHTELARAGLYVEPTSAVCWAAISSFGLEDAVAPLCGSGLKSKPPA